MKEKIVKSIIVIAVIISIAIFIYGVGCAGKIVSYKLFYRDMVRAEITRMVIPSALTP